MCDDTHGNVLLTFRKEDRHTKKTVTAECTMLIKLCCKCNGGEGTRATYSEFSIFILKLITMILVLISRSTDCHLFAETLFSLPTDTDHLMEDNDETVFDYSFN